MSEQKPLRTGPSDKHLDKKISGDQHKVIDITLERVVPHSAEGVFYEYAAEDVWLSHTRYYVALSVKRLWRKPSHTDTKVDQRPATK